jgi:hypothetical protein
VETSDEVTQEEEWVAERMKKSQKRMKENVNVIRREEVFEEGKEVLLATKDFNLSQYSSKPCRKLGQKYFGPYKVVKVLDKGAYKLELPKALAMHPVFYTLQLRKYKDPQEFEDWPVKEERTDYSKSNKKKRIVEIKGRRMKKGVAQYLVKWENVDELVWIPVRNLEYAHKQILEWKKLNKKEKEEEEEEDGEERDEEEEDEEKRDEEEVDETLVDKRKSKKSTGKREMKVLLD